MNAWLAGSCLLKVEFAVSHERFILRITNISGFKLNLVDTYRHVGCRVKSQEAWHVLSSASQGNAYLMFTMFTHILCVCRQVKVKFQHYPQFNGLPKTHHV